MDASWLGWYLAVLGALAVAGIVIGWRRHRAKTQRMRVFAHQRGWQYTHVDRSLGRRYEGTPFGRGSGRQASFVVAGPHRGTRFLAFEYRYTERSGENSTTYRFTVVVIELPAHRPRLEVTRETGTSRLLGRFGLRDLQLESEQFNDTFRIGTDDDRFAYDVLTPTTMEWLLAHGRFPFRFGGGHLLTWRRGTITPEAAQTMLDYACDLRDRVPAYVWRAA
jgi:hypothetical protein